MDPFLYERDIGFQNDVVRNVVPSHNYFDETFWGDIPLPEEKKSAPEPKKHASVEKFQNGDVAPSDYGDGLETNKFSVNDEPVEVGNRLLVFLEQEVDARITKFNRKRFSFKADVFLGVACTVKVRIFKRVLPPKSETSDAAPTAV